MQKMHRKPADNVTSWRAVTPQVNVIDKWNAVAEQFNKQLKESENRKTFELTPLVEEGVCNGLAFTYQQYCAMGDEDSFFMLLNLFDRLTIEEILLEIKRKTPLASKLHKFITQVRHLQITQDRLRTSIYTSAKRIGVGVDNITQVHASVATVEDIKNALRHLQTSDMGMKIGLPEHAISIYRSGDDFLVYDSNDTNRLKTSDLSQAASYILKYVVQYAKERLTESVKDSSGLGQTASFVKKSFAAIKMKLAETSASLFNTIPDVLLSPVVIAMTIMRHNVVKEETAATKSSYGAINQKCNKTIAKDKSPLTKQEKCVLNWAIVDNNIEQLKEEVEGRQVNFNEPWPYGLVYGEDKWIYPLNWAILHNSQECIDFLLEHGATPNTDGILHNAVIMGNTSSVGKLLKHGADVNAIAPLRILNEGDEPYTTFPLFLAVKDPGNYNDTMLELLLNQSHIDINQELPNAPGTTALTRATLKGNQAAVELLLKKGAIITENTWLALDKIAEKFPEIEKLFENELKARSEPITNIPGLFL